MQPWAAVVIIFVVGVLFGSVLQEGHGEYLYRIGMSTGRNLGCIDTFKELGQRSELLGCRIDGKCS